MSNRHAPPKHPLHPSPSAWLLGCMLGVQALACQAIADPLVANPAAAGQAPAACSAAPAGQTLDEALAALRTLEPQCHKHAPYLYALGQLLNQAGQYEAAIDPLEGAIMYRPDHWPSQLEYAIALEGIGDHTSAQALVQSLQHHPDVDDATRQQLQALLQRPAPAPATARRGTFNMVTGYDNNLLNSSYHSQFTLTTPDGPLPVELDEDQQPRAGSFVRAELSYDGLLAANASTQWRYSLVGSYRSNPSLTAANMAQLGALLERSSTGSSGPYVLAQHQALMRADSVTLRQTQVGLGYDLPMGSGHACLQRVGLDLQHLSYPTSTALDGRYTGLISNTVCAALGVQVLLRVGQDQPVDSTRPGGPQRQTSLRITKRTQVGDGTFALEWEGAHQQDQTGYSTLLANNEQRSINRFAYRLEYRWQLGTLSPYMGVEWLDQRSNLALFESKNWIATLGFRSRW